MANISDLESEYDRRDVSEMMALMKPPASIVCVLSLIMILHLGKKVDQSWNNIRKELVGDVHNYLKKYNKQIDCLIDCIE